MNIYISDSIKQLNTNYTGEQILPHQLAKLDFIYKKIYNDEESVLLFDKMGSGKTIVSLLVAIFLSKENKKISIVLPSNNIKNIWESKLNLIKKLTPFDNYNYENIYFQTKKTFMSLIKSNIVSFDVENLEEDGDNDDVFSLFNKNIKKKKENIIIDESFDRVFQNHVIIIDEAHNFFGNQGSELLSIINNHYKNLYQKPLYILVTGSPIINTMLTLKDLINILCYENINEEDYMLQEGGRILNYQLTNKGRELLKEKLHDKVSYYDQGVDEIPQKKFIGKALITIPMIPCVMSKEQNYYYEQIKNEITQDMFFKYLLEASFTALPSKNFIFNFKEYSKTGSVYTITKTLSLNKGVFVGEELKTLNNSCKIKYFVEKKIKNPTKIGKTFIFFSNSRIGGRFLKDVLKAQGVQEYGSKQLENYICIYCGDKHTCEICKPMTYALVTSIYLTNFKNDFEEIDDEEKNDSINSLLNVYNSTSNDEGEIITFLFGSLIISESYTLTETREIWFLTIPNSLSKMSQIMARALRNFSYKDLSEPVNIYLLAAITNDFNIDSNIKKIKSDKIFALSDFKEDDETEIYIKSLMDNNTYPNDIKRLLYLEIKSRQTNEIHAILKSLSIDKKEKIEKNIEKIYVIEMLRRVAFYNTRFTINLLLNYIPNQLMSYDSIEKYINEFIADKIIIYNKIYKQSFLKKINNEYNVFPIEISYLPFLYKISVDNV